MSWKEFLTQPNWWLGERCRTVGGLHMDLCSPKFTALIYLKDPAFVHENMFRYFWFDSEHPLPVFQTAGFHAGLPYDITQWTEGLHPYRGHLLWFYRPIPQYPNLFVITPCDLQAPSPPQIQSQQQYSQQRSRGPTPAAPIAPPVQMSLEDFLEDPLPLR